MIEKITFYNPQYRDMDLTISEIFGEEKESVAKKLKEMDSATDISRINRVTLIHTIMTIICL